MSTYANDPLVDPAAWLADASAATHPVMAATPTAMAVVTNLISTDLVCSRLLFCGVMSIVNTYRVVTLEGGSYCETEYGFFLGLELIIKYVVALRVPSVNEPERHVEHRHEEAQLDTCRSLERVQGKIAPKSCTWPVS